MLKNSRKMLPISAAVALAVSGFSGAQAQSGAQEIEEIVVSGLRGKPRTALDSPVPIDTFDIEAIESISHTDTQDILRTLIPSFNVARAPISDGATFIRNSELRGLPAHHTLVLVNGKRRHRASLVAIGGSGRQGPDVATIPSTAIQSVDVLRDGASAQYGSDAIAGVINFNLKNNREGFTLTADTGTFQEGDGDSTTIQANVGLPLGQNGFLSLSGEFNEADATERGEQYCESFFCVSPNESRFGTVTNQIRRDFALGNATQIPNLTDPNLPSELQGFSREELTYLNGLQQAYPGGVAAASVEGNNVQPWGQPNAESLRLFYNAGYDLDNGVELYSFGNYSDSSGDGGFFYRFPGNGTAETVRRPDGQFFNPLEIFPGGFTPRFEGEIEDIGWVGGIRGGGDGAFSWDVSARYGSNEIEYRLFNTVNPSFGFATPTDFNPGSLTNEEFQIQVDLASEFDIGTASPLVFAYGLSYFDESYEVGESSDTASFEAGPHALQDPFGFCDPNGNPTTTAGSGAFNSFGGVQAVAGVNVPGLDCNNSSDPSFTVVGVGSNGFPGFSPAFSEDFERDSFALYGDLSTDLGDSLFVQVAARYEDYSDFGNEFVGKVAARWLVNENIAVRGSYGTGFRAPTPGQQGTTNVSTRLPNGVPVATGLFPPSSAVAQALGATALDAETSTSFTIGLTAQIEDLSVTIDYYSIDIDDRFNAISTLDVSPTAAVGSDALNNFLALSNAGVPGAESIGGVFFFTNAFDTETSGIDVVASYPVIWGNGQETNLQFALNWTDSELASDATAFLNAEDEFDFENARPNVRWNFTAQHRFNDQFSLLGRALYYGEYENSQRTGGTPPLFIQRYGSEIFLDLEAAWRFNDSWRVVVGGRNIADRFPDQTNRAVNGNDFCCGRTFDSGSTVPWQGGYYYGRITYNL